MPLIKIPRAVLYMKWWESLVSLVKLPFSKPSGHCQVPVFERGFADMYGMNNAIAMPNGRISLYSILKSLELEPGSEVIMTPINIPDMVNMIHLLGLKPVFVDISLKDYGPDNIELDSVVTEKSRVLFITNLCGISPDWEHLRKVADEKGLYLIHDCTQGHLAKWNDRYIAQYADATFFSLCNLKDIHTHVGGMIITNNELWSKKLENMRLLDFKPMTKKYLLHYILEDVVACIATIPWLFSFTLYYLFRLIPLPVIEKVTNGEGLQLNYWWNPFRKMSLFKGFFGGSEVFLREELPEKMLKRMSSFQAKIGLKQMSRLEDLVGKRQLVTRSLINKLTGETKKLFCRHLLNEGNVHWRLAILPEGTRDFQKQLLKFGFDNAKTNLLVLSECPEFKQYAKATPNARYFKRHAVFLPNHYYLSERKIEKMAEAIEKSL